MLRLHALAYRRVAWRGVATFSTSTTSVDKIDKYRGQIWQKLDNRGYKTTEGDVDAALALLRSLGLTPQQAFTSLLRYPQIASFSPDVILDRYGHLQDIGMSRKELVKSIGRHGTIVGVPSEQVDTIRDWYLAQGVLPTKIPFIFTVFPQVASLSIENTLEPKVRFWREVGLSNHQVTSILQRMPQCMTISLERMRHKVDFLQELNLDRVALTKFIVYVPEVMSMSMETIRARMAFLDHYFGEGAWRTMWVKVPRVIMYKTESLEKSIDFLVNVVGMDLGLLEKYPGLMMRSRENILEPRYEFLLKVRGADELKNSAPWIRASHQKFMEKYPAYEDYYAEHMLKKKE